MKKTGLRIEDLPRHGGAERLAAILSAGGVRELYPPQVAAVSAGLLATRDSLVIASPTASGKTLIAEMAALQTFLETGRKTLYLVPLRALAREKFEELSRKYSPFGIEVSQSTGDLDSADPWLAAADIIVSTNEKLDSLLRHRAPWLSRVGLVIADEVHLIGDSRRGPTLEVILTRLKGLTPPLRFVALSATIPNAADIAEWLGARLVQSSWRPVPLREGVYRNGAVIFNDGTVKWTEQSTKIEAIDLALETIREGGQVLVFVNTRKAAEALAAAAASRVARLIVEGELEGLARLSARVLAQGEESTRLDGRLAECVAGGSAFHHAGIASSRRKLIEDGFKENRIRLLAATTTLAMGLNLPSRRVVIRDWLRFEPGMGLVPLPVLEVRQMGGRAGRPGLDPFGEAVLVARDRQDERRLFSDYIKGEVEQTQSWLASESALRSHILASVAAGFTSTRCAIDDFLAATFCARRIGGAALARIAAEIVAFLIREEMVVEHGEMLAATHFGRRTAELYIDPLTAVSLRDSLRRADRPEPLPLFHMLTRTPDMALLHLRKRDLDEYIPLFYRWRADLLTGEEERSPTEEALAELKTASCLAQWIEEQTEDALSERFGIGPGDLHSLVRVCEWLLHAAEQVARIFGRTHAEGALAELRARVAYGVREELLELVALRGVGRVRSRNLFEAGYRGIDELREATPSDLARVSAIGAKGAEEILAEVESLSSAKRGRGRAGRGTSGLLTEGEAKQPRSPSGRRRP